MSECLYCTADEKIMGSLLEVAKLNVSTFYLSKEQTHPGRSVVVLNWHIDELFQLDPEDRRLFAEDLATAAAALYKVFKPKKINYAIYGDLVPHMHCHLTPKYEGGDCLGEPFNANPVDKRLLSDEDYVKLIILIKSAL